MICLKLDAIDGIRAIVRSNDVNALAAQRAHGARIESGALCASAPRPNVLEIAMPCSSLKPDLSQMTSPAVVGADDHHIGGRGRGLMSNPMGQSIQSAKPLRTDVLGHLTAQFLQVFYGL
jgi:hypothetical protein